MFISNLSLEYNAGNATTGSNWNPTGFYSPFLLFLYLWSNKPETRHFNRHILIGTEVNQSWESQKVHYQKGVPSAVGFPHCAGSGEGLSLAPSLARTNVQRPGFELGTFRLQTVGSTVAPGPPYKAGDLGSLKIANIYLVTWAHFSCAAYLHKIHTSLNMHST
jgi:hypothetical protein